MHKTRKEARSFIGGEWVLGNGHDAEPVYDRAMGEVIAETPSRRRKTSTGLFRQPVRPSGSGRRPWWCSVSRFSFASKRSGLRDLVTLETGKDARDAGGEVRRRIEVVEFACGMPTLLWARPSGTWRGG